MMPPKPIDQRLEEAKRRAATLVSLMDILNKPVDAATIQKAALVKLSPAAIQAAGNLAYLALANIDGVDLIPPDLRAVCREVLGLDNLAIRKKLQRWFESGEGLGSATFRHVMLMGYGQPKHAMESGDKSRAPVVFLSPSGFAPWDPNSPTNKALDARSAAMIKAKDEQLALEAADRKAAETVIDVSSAPTEPEEDTLERVIPPPNDDPAAFR